MKRKRNSWALLHRMIKTEITKNGLSRLDLEDAANIQNMLRPIHAKHPRACFVFTFLFRRLKRNGRRENHKFSCRRFSWKRRSADECGNNGRTFLHILLINVCCSLFRHCLILTIFAWLDAMQWSNRNCVCAMHASKHIIIINNDTKNKAINIRLLESVLGVAWRTGDNKSLYTETREWERESARERKTRFSHLHTYTLNVGIARIIWPVRHSHRTSHLSQHATSVFANELRTYWYTVPRRRNAAVYEVQRWRNDNSNCVFILPISPTHLSCQCVLFHPPILPHVRLFCANKLSRNRRSEWFIVSMTSLASLAIFFLLSRIRRKLRIHRMKLKRRNGDVEYIISVRN